MKTRSFGPCGCPFLMSCLQWRPLHWSYATVVPLFLLLALYGEMLLLPGRQCCHGWVHRKWYLCHYQQKSLEGSCSCSALIRCALHCHTISHHCEHWKHCWIKYYCWNGWSSGCQTTEETTIQKKKQTDLQVYFGIMAVKRRRKQMVTKSPMHNRSSSTLRDWIDTLRRLINPKAFVPM